MTTLTNTAATSILSARGRRPGLILMHREDGGLSRRGRRALRVREGGPDQRTADWSVISFLRCVTPISRRLDVRSLGSRLWIFRIASRAIVFAHPIDWVLFAAITTESRCDDNDAAWDRPLENVNAQESEV